MNRIWVKSTVVLALLACGCGGEEPEESEPDEQDLTPEDEAGEGKTAEAQYEPTKFCLDNDAPPLTPNVGPAALGETVLGTSGRADEFGNETWGAEYGAELSLQGVSGGPRGVETLIRGELVGSATVFDFSQDVVRIVLDGVSAGDGMTGFDASLVILDRFTFPLFDYEGNFSDEKHFSAPLFTANTGVPLVPGLAPVEVSATATGQLGYVISGQILPKGIVVVVRPEAAILVTAQASVGSEGIASARVEGQVELIRLSVPIQAALTFDDQNNIEFSWDVRVDMDAAWLSGDLEVVASAFGEDRYRKSIAEWEGWDLTVSHLSDGAGSIFPGAPGTCTPSELQRGDDTLDRLALAPETAPETARTGPSEVLDLGLQADAEGAVPTETLAELSQAFERASGAQRNKAGYALGNALSVLSPYEPEVATASIESLEAAYRSTDDVDEQVLLLRVLGNAGSTNSLPLIQEALEHEERRVRVTAVQALRHVPDREADDTLSGVMFDTHAHAQVRAAAVRTAGARRTTSGYEAVADLAVRDTDSWVQVAALHTLGRAVTRSEDAAEALRHLEANADLEQVRAIARNYLYRLDAVEDRH